MSELNKKLSALSRQPGQQKGTAYSDIKPATIKPIRQANLKPWAALGVLGLGVAMGFGGWQLWQSDEPVSEVVKAVNPVATAQAAPVLSVVEPTAEQQTITTAASPVVATKQQAEVGAESNRQPDTKVSTPKQAVSTSTEPKASESKSAKAEDLVAKKAETKAPTTKAPITKTPVANTPNANTPKAEAPKAKPVISEPVGVAVATNPATDVQASREIEIEDGDESLMIETVELDAGQLAQIEYQRAEKALKEGDSRKAIGYLETAVKYNPQWITARQKLAALYYGRGDSRRAITTLQQGLVLDSNQPDLRLTMAKLLVNESQQQAALNVLGPLPAYAHSGYLAMRGALAQQLNQNDLALSSYQGLVKAEPYDGRWWLGLGVALERGQELAQAEEAYQQALQMGQISGETQQFIRQRLAVLAKSKG